MFITRIICQNLIHTYIWKVRIKSRSGLLHCTAFKDLWEDLQFSSDSQEDVEPISSVRTVDLSVQTVTASVRTGSAASRATKWRNLLLVSILTTFK